MDGDLACTGFETDFETMELVVEVFEIDEMKNIEVSAFVAVETAVDVDVEVVVEGILVEVDEVVCIVVSRNKDGVKIEFVEVVRRLMAEFLELISLAEAVD